MQLNSMTLYFMENKKEYALDMSDLEVRVTLTAPQGFILDENQLKKMALIMIESGQSYINLIFNPEFNFKNQKTH